MKFVFAALLMLPLIAVSTPALADETLGSAIAPSQGDAVEQARAMLAKRVERACATKAKGGVAEGIAAPTCKVDQLSTGKWNAVCTVKFRCKNS